VPEFERPPDIVGGGNAVADTDAVGELVELPIVVLGMLVDDTPVVRLPGVQLLTHDTIWPSMVAVTSTLPAASVLRLFGQSFTHDTIAPSMVAVTQAEGATEAVGVVKESAELIDLGSAECVAKVDAATE